MKVIALHYIEFFFTKILCKKIKVKILLHLEYTNAKDYSWNKNFYFLSSELASRLLLFLSGEQFSIRIGSLYIYVSKSFLWTFLATL